MNPKREKRVSIGSSEMKAFWWNKEYQIIGGSNKELCDFDDYGVNRQFFSALVDMNTLHDKFRLHSLDNFVLPKKMSFANNTMAVVEPSGLYDRVDMYNTGQEPIQVGDCVGLVPPLTQQEAFYVFVGRTEQPYAVPLTVATEQYNSDLLLLQKYLQVLAVSKTHGDSEKLNSDAEAITSFLAGNNIFEAVVNTRRFESTTNALLHISNIHADTVAKEDLTHDAEVHTLLHDIRELLDTNTPVKKRAALIHRIYRNKYSLMNDKVRVVSKCVVEYNTSYEIPRVGPVVVEPSGKCLVRRAHTS